MWSLRWHRAPLYGVITWNKCQVKNEEQITTVEETVSDSNFTMRNLKTEPASHTLYFKGLGKLNDTWN